MTPGFSLKVRVYYEDTDAGGVVFYANYLKFMERARTEWLREAGFEQDRLMQEEGVVFAVTSVNMDFLKPAHFNEQLDVTVAINKLGRASLKVSQQILRDGELLNRADVKLACVDQESFTATRLPESIYNTIKSLE